MKKTLKKRLALEHDTLRVLTEKPETKSPHTVKQYDTPAPSSTVPKDCPGSTGPCTCVC